MKDKEHSEILYGWFFRAAFIQLVILLLLAWIFSLPKWVEAFISGDDVLLDFVIQLGSLWQAYLPMFGLIGVKLMLTFSEGFSMAMLYIIKEMWRRFFNREVGIGS